MGYKQEKYLKARSLCILKSYLLKKEVFLSLFKKRSEQDLAKEFSELKKRADRLEKELERLEGLEKSLAQNEVVLAKKITDINRIEQELEKRVYKHEFESLKKELKRFDEHDDILAENTKLMREIINELGKVKESHKMTRKHVISKENISKSECEDRFGAIKEALEDLEKIRKTHKKKVGHHDLANLRKEFHDRISQVEHQNKMLMSYLKKVDELLNKKTEKT